MRWRGSEGKRAEGEKLKGGKKSAHTSDGFTTTLFPAANAGAIFFMAIRSG